MYRYSTLDADRMTKFDKAKLALGSMIVLVGVPVYVALTIYMILKACIG